MADPIAAPDPRGEQAFPRTLDEAREMARGRFKERLQNGEKIGDCDCGTEPTNGQGEPQYRVTGVRFLDSGRLYYFDPGDLSLSVGDWVVADTARGREAGRVVLAPHQVRMSMLTGELKPIARLLGEDDVEKMERFKREAAIAVKTFGQRVRERGLPMKPISADYNFDGTHLTLNFTAPERIDFRDLAKDLSAVFRCRVELRQVGPRDEARLLGGLGRCGRTLCCSSWLPVYPEISMNMAKTQDLPLNPGKVSGVCGRLLCCLSYENEQYRQMRTAMPRLGQIIETPAGEGMVIAMQILKEQVTVRLGADSTEHQFAANELGYRRPDVAPVEIKPSVPAAQPDVEPEPALEAPGDGAPARRRRRRGRGRNRGGGDAPPTPVA